MLWLYVNHEHGRADSGRGVSVWWCSRYFRRLTTDLEDRLSHWPIAVLAKSSHFNPPPPTGSLNEAGEPGAVQRQGTSPSQSLMIHQANSAEIGVGGGSGENARADVEISPECALPEVSRKDTYPFPRWS